MAGEQSGLKDKFDALVSSDISPDGGKQDFDININCKAATQLLQDHREVIVGNIMSTGSTVEQANQTVDSIIHGLDILRSHEIDDASLECVDDPAGNNEHHAPPL